MNFPQILASNTIDEWKDYYLSYEMLMAALKLNDHLLTLDADGNAKKDDYDQLPDVPNDNRMSALVKLRTLKTLIIIEEKSNDIDLYGNSDDDDNDLKRMSDIDDEEDDDDDDDDDDVEEEEKSNNTSIANLTLNKLKTLINIEQQTDDIFKNMICFEGKKVNSFYLHIEKQLIKEYKLIAKSLSRETFSTQFNIKMDDKNSNNKKYDDNDDDLKAINCNVDKLHCLEPLNIPNSLQIKSGKKSIANNKELQKTRKIYLSQMKKNIFLLYQRFIVLSNFAKLNAMGFEILINKFNKMMNINENESELNSIINNFEFVESNKCKECMNKLIILYSDYFEDGNINHGKIRLFNSISWNNIKNKLLNNDRSIFKFGTKFGVMLGLFCWAMTVLLIFLNDHSYEPLPKEVIYIYRSCGLITLFLWLWSICIYIWSSKRINFVFIFELNPRNALTFIDYFDFSTHLTIIYLFDVILFIQTFKYFGEFYSMIWPLTLFIFYILRLILPVFDHWISRKMILNSLYQCIIAPFGRVAFRDFFLADILSSFSYQIVDFYMSSCLFLFHAFASSSHSNYYFCIESTFSKWMKIILICIPYWIRFMQKLNNYFYAHHGHKKEKAFGALKYGLGLSVKLIGSFTKGPLWIFFTIISTIYFIFWDIKMDWDLLPWSKRTKLYPNYWYYVGLFFEILIRSFWVFTLFPDNNNWEHFKLPLYGFILFSNIGEIFRRAIWSIFRVEKAHLGKQDEFKTYQYIPDFYENNTLNQENLKQQHKQKKNVLMEVIAMFLLLVVVAAFIILTLHFQVKLIED